ncbi:hypothetical protein PAPYR_10229 [Paratrimastix pyriformis]|uniref:Uncharacterized protein n=1 Tax=Paratrimastix pyriformis TaxID=342808 RepID=A0ABQ8UDM3_9EUKA|nr:hypothetical protein PAPYR_10229 [Paratrimastix pyriformis]
MAQPPSRTNDSGSEAPASAAPASEAVTPSSSSASLQAPRWMTCMPAYNCVGLPFDVSIHADHLLRGRALETETISAACFFSEAMGPLSPPPTSEDYPADALPEPSDALPESSDALPEPSDALPGSSDALPESSGALPESSDALPEPSDALPEPSDALPGSSDALPESSDALPESSGALPEPSDALPGSSDVRAGVADDDTPLFPIKVNSDQQRVDALAQLCHECFVPAHGLFLGSAGPATLDDCKVPSVYVDDECASVMEHRIATRGEGVKPAVSWEGEILWAGPPGQLSGIIEAFLAGGPTLGNPGPTPPTGGNKDLPECFRRWADRLARLAARLTANPPGEEQGLIVPSWVLLGDGTEWQLIKASKPLHGWVSRDPLREPLYDGVPLQGASKRPFFETVNHVEAPQATRTAAGLTLHQTALTILRLGDGRAGFCPTEGTLLTRADADRYVKDCGGHPLIRQMALCLTRHPTDPQTCT